MVEVNGKNYNMFDWWHGRYVQEDSTPGNLRWQDLNPKDFGIFVSNTSNSGNAINIDNIETENKRRMLLGDVIFLLNDNVQAGGTVTPHDQLSQLMQKIIRDFPYTADTILRNFIEALFTTMDEPDNRDTEVNEEFKQAFNAGAKKLVGRIGDEEKWENLSLDVELVKTRIRRAMDDLPQSVEKGLRPVADSGSLQAYLKANGIWEREQVTTPQVDPPRPNIVQTRPSFVQGTKPTFLSPDDFRHEPDDGLKGNEALRQWENLRPGLTKWLGTANSEIFATDGSLTKVGSEVGSEKALFSQVRRREGSEGVHSVRQTVTLPNRRDVYSMLASIVFHGAGVLARDGEKYTGQGAVIDWGTMRDNAKNEKKADGSKKWTDDDLKSPENFEKAWEANLKTQLKELTEKIDFNNCVITVNQQSTIYDMYFGLSDWNPATVTADNNLVLSRVEALKGILENAGIEKEKLKEFKPIIIYTVNNGETYEINRETYEIEGKTYEINDEKLTLISLIKELREIINQEINAYIKDITSIKTDEFEEKINKIIIKFIAVTKRVDAGELEANNKGKDPKPAMIAFMFKNIEAAITKRKLIDEIPIVTNQELINGVTINGFYFQLPSGTLVPDNAGHKAAYLLGVEKAPEAGDIDIANRPIEYLETDLQAWEYAKDGYNDSLTAIREQLQPDIDTNGDDKDDTLSRNRFEGKDSNGLKVGQSVVERFNDLTARFALAVAAQAQGSGTSGLVNHSLQRIYDELIALEKIIDSLEENFKSETDTKESPTGEIKDKLGKTVDGTPGVNPATEVLRGLITDNVTRIYGASLGWPVEVLQRELIAFFSGQELAPYSWAEIGEAIIHADFLPKLSPENQAIADAARRMAGIENDDAQRQYASCREALAAFMSVSRTRLQAVRDAYEKEKSAFDKVAPQDTSIPWDDLAVRQKAVTEPGKSVPYGLPERSLLLGVDEAKNNTNTGILEALDGTSQPHVVDRTLIFDPRYIPADWEILSAYRSTTEDYLLALQDFEVAREALFRGIEALDGDGTAEGRARIIEEIKLIQYDAATGDISPNDTAVAEQARILLEAYKAKLRVVSEKAADLQKLTLRARQNSDKHNTEKGLLNPAEPLTAEQSAEKARNEALAISLETETQRFLEVFSLLPTDKKINVDGVGLHEIAELFQKLADALTWHDYVGARKIQADLNNIIIINGEIVDGLWAVVGEVRQGILADNPDSTEDISDYLATIYGQAAVDEDGQIIIISDKAAVVRAVDDYFGAAQPPEEPHYSSQRYSEIIMDPPEGIPNYVREGIDGKRVDASGHLVNGPTKGITTLIEYNQKYRDAVSALESSNYKRGSLETRIKELENKGRLNGDEKKELLDKHEALLTEKRKYNDELLPTALAAFAALQDLLVNVPLVEGSPTGVFGRAVDATNQENTKNPIEFDYGIDDEELQVLRDRKFADLEPYLKIAPSIKQDVENADINSSRPQNLEHPQDFFNSLGLVMSAVIGGQVSPIEEVAAEKAPDAVDGQAEEAAAEKTPDEVDGQTEGAATEESPDTAVPPPAAATPPVSVADIIETLKGSSRYDKTGNEVKGAVSLPLTAVPDDVDQRENAMVWTTEQRDEKAKTDYENWRKYVESAIQPYRPDFTFPLKADDGVEADYQELIITHPAGEFEGDVEDKFARHSREILLGNEAARNEFEKNYTEIKDRITAAERSGHIPDPYDQLLLWAADRLRVDRINERGASMNRGWERIDFPLGNFYTGNAGDLYSLNVKNDESSVVRFSSFGNNVGNSYPLNVKNGESSMVFTPGVSFDSNSLRKIGLGFSGVVGELVQYSGNVYWGQSNLEAEHDSMNAGGDVAFQFNPWYEHNNPFLQNLYFRSMMGLHWTRSSQTWTYDVNMPVKNDAGDYIWEIKDSKIVTITLEELEEILKGLDISDGEREDVIEASRTAGAAASATTPKSLRISEVYNEAIGAGLDEEAAIALVTAALPKIEDLPAVFADPARYRTISAAEYAAGDDDIDLFEKLGLDPNNYIEGVRSPAGYTTTDTEKPNGQVFSDTTYKKVKDAITTYVNGSDRPWKDASPEQKNAIINALVAKITRVVSGTTGTSTPLSNEDWDDLRTDVEDAIETLASSWSDELSENLEHWPAISSTTEVPALADAILEDATFEFENDGVTVDSSGNFILTAVDNTALENELRRYINNPPSDTPDKLKRKLGLIAKDEDKITKLVNRLVALAVTVVASLGEKNGTKKHDAEWDTLRGIIIEWIEDVAPTLKDNNTVAGNLADKILEDATFEFENDGVTVDSSGNFILTAVDNTALENELRRYINNPPSDTPDKLKRKLGLIAKDEDKITKLVNRLVALAVTVVASLGEKNGTKKHDADWGTLRGIIIEWIEDVAPTLKDNNTVAGNLADKILEDATFEFDIDNVSKNTVASHKFTASTRGAVEEAITTYVNTTTDRPYAKMNETQRTNISNKWKGFIDLVLVGDIRNGVTTIDPITGNDEVTFKANIKAFVLTKISGFTDADINAIVDYIFNNYRSESTSTEKSNFRLSTEIGSFTPITRTATTIQDAENAAKDAMRQQILADQSMSEVNSESEKNRVLDAYATDHFTVTTSPSTSYSYSRGASKGTQWGAVLSSDNENQTEDERTTAIRNNIKNELSSVYGNDVAEDLASNWPISFSNTNIYAPAITGLNPGYSNGNVTFNITPPPQDYKMEIKLIKDDGTTIEDDNAVQVDSAGNISIFNSYLYNTHSSPSTSVNYRVVVTISSNPLDPNKNIQNAEIFDYTFTQDLNNFSVPRITLPAVGAGAIKNPYRKQARVEEHNITATPTTTYTSTVTCSKYALAYDEAETTTYETDKFNSLNITYNSNDITITGGIYEAEMQDVDAGGKGIRKISLLGEFEAEMQDVNAGGKGISKISLLGEYQAIVGNNISTTYSCKELEVSVTEGELQSIKMPLLLDSVKIPGVNRYAKPETTKETREADGDKHNLFAYAGGDVMWNGPLAAWDNGLRLWGSFWLGGGWSMSKEWFTGLTDFERMMIGVQDSIFHAGDLYYGIQLKVGQKDGGLYGISTVEDPFDKLDALGNMPKNHRYPRLFSGIGYEGKYFRLEATYGWNWREKGPYGSIVGLAGRFAIPLTDIFTTYGNAKAEVTFPETGNLMEGSANLGFMFRLPSQGRVTWELGVEGSGSLKTDYRDILDWKFVVGPFVRLGIR
ncbi:hypothetical protein NO2_0082 [Candidatus Termititenax persephonae]|uniref:Uncharacterized protein n=1 Tax=Candidatus Termititenax persephonae TaxID=2218525 RepID=A0A388TFJ2_9BACT|nr:hypothetical protein NO2_0082 [Candidatus Termititenax persephonae]